VGKNARKPRGNATSCLSMNLIHGLSKTRHPSKRCVRQDTLTYISVKTNYASTKFVKSHVKLTAFDIEILHKSLALDKSCCSCFITPTHRLSVFPNKV